MYVLPPERKQVIQQMSQVILQIISHADNDDEL